MATHKAKLQSQPEEVQVENAIRVIIADSEPIFRVGVRKIVAVEDDIRIVAQVENVESALSSVARFEADVMLYESGLGSNAGDVISSILAVAPALKVVLVTVQQTEEETVELLRRGATGETWLDNQGVNWVIEAYRAQAAQLTGPRNRVRLSNKELQIISGVTQGLRNKDIAKDVGTTEQVVKNYLRKVYDKLGVSDRLELALYCMHHKLLENYQKAEEGAAENRDGDPAALEA
jgi:DNA-binding NarL/FixJ family response regulator